MQYMNRTNTQYFLGDIDFMQTAGVTSANYTYNLKVYYAVVILTFANMQLFLAVFPQMHGRIRWHGKLFSIFVSLHPLEYF